MKESLIEHVAIEDGSHFPRVKDAKDSRMDSVQWRLIHNPASFEDWELKELASIIGAYKNLTEGSTGAKKLPMVRRAFKKSK
jgi:hypothetical protein